MKIHKFVSRTKTNRRSTTIFKRIPYFGAVIFFFLPLFSTNNSIVRLGVSLIQFFYAIGGGFYMVVYMNAWLYKRNREGFLWKRIRLPKKLFHILYGYWQKSSYEFSPEMYWIPLVIFGAVFMYALAHLACYFFFLYDFFSVTQYISEDMYVDIYLWLHILFNVLAIPLSAVALITHKKMFVATSDRVKLHDLLKGSYQEKQIINDYKLREKVMKSVRPLVFPESAKKHTYAVLQQDTVALEKLIASNFRKTYSRVVKDEKGKTLFAIHSKKTNRVLLEAIVKTQK